MTAFLTHIRIAAAIRLPARASPVCANEVPENESQRTRGGARCVSYITRRRMNARASEPPVRHMREGGILVEESARRWRVAREVETKAGREA